MPGAAIGDLKRAHSHTVALGQVRHSLRRAGTDAGGARPIPPARRSWSRNGAGKEEAAIASSLAAEIYGLEILRANIEDAAHNTTRFYVMARAAGGRAIRPSRT